MSPSPRTCYLFDEYGQQAGPFSNDEALRFLEQGLRDGQRPRRFKVWKLGWPTRLGADEARARLSGARRTPPTWKGFLGRWRG